MDNSLITTIKENIKKTYNYYQCTPPSRKEEDVQVKQYKCLLTEKGLSSLNYKIDSTNKKNQEKDYLRNLDRKSKTPKKETFITDITEIEALDNQPLPWNRLDNWRKRKILEEYVNTYHQANPEAKRYLNTLLGKNTFKRTKDVEFDKEKQILTEIKIEEVKLYLNSLHS